MLRFTSVLVLTWLNAQLAPGQDFRVDTLARGSDAGYPTSIAFTPDSSGRFFYTEKNSGRVRIYDHGLLPSPFASVAVENDGEQGLLGVAVYPGYPDTPWVYLYYTRRVDRSNVVERYRDSAGVGLDPMLVLIVPRTLDGSSNNGGCIQFGPDRRLYVSVGDYGQGRVVAEDTAAPRNPRGKILRLNPDGSIPSDNPFPGKPYWAYGLTNCSGLTFDALTGEMYCTLSEAHAGDCIVKVHRGENLGPPAPLWRSSSSPTPGLAGLVLYRSEAFPRLRGKLLFGGTSSPTIQLGMPNDAGDTLAVGPLFKSLGGFSAVAVGPTGDIYLANGPYFASRILRLSPIPPAFTTAPFAGATQDQQYRYTPEFTGTPPSVSLLSGPPGMTVDSERTVRWTPTNAEALEGSCNVLLLAVNGAGSAEQGFTVSVENVNDPPSGFTLNAPGDQASFGFFGGEPQVTFSWSPASDPDRDTLRYLFEIDTTAAFNSPALVDSAVGADDSLKVLLPKVNAEYYWRVFATDGRLRTTGTPAISRLNVSFFAPQPLELKEKPRASVLEQNYPNPFNPATSIKYTVPHSGRVRLTVFNLLGQEVARLIDGFQAEGTYEFEFNRMNLPSGIYFYRIQAPGFVETKKMVVAK